MTEHMHEWEWFKYDGHYHCQVSGCDERRHPIKMEPNLNARERLSAEDARGLANLCMNMQEKAYHDTKFPSLRESSVKFWKALLIKLKAYADTLEEK